MCWRRLFRRKSQQEALDRAKQLEQEHVVTKEEFLDEVHLEGEQVEQLRSLLSAPKRRRTKAKRAKPTKRAKKTKRVAKKPVKRKTKKRPARKKRAGSSRKRKSSSRKRR